MNLEGSRNSLLLLTVLSLSAILVVSTPLSALALNVPSLEVEDTPDDWGSSLTLTWLPLPTEEAVKLEIWRFTAPRGESLGDWALPDTGSAADLLRAGGWEQVGTADPGDSTFVDTELDPANSYFYLIAVEGGTVDDVSAPTEPQTPRRQIIRYQRINIMVAVALFIATVVLLVERARRGARFFIRKIAGLEAVDEAVGRSTEMGRPILYIPGLDPMDEVGTVASINILGQVAKKAGEYETKLIVPNRDPIVMAVAQEVVRESYSTIGKPHLYHDEDVFYVTYSQFGFAAAAAGIMMRERPATNFLIGRFYAESLVLAETGNATGAIQIAGTDSDAQLPFFITACDYTLIGEELYAGSVYLSREPLLMGALKGQDYAKAVVIAAIILGTVLSIVSPDLAAKFTAIFR